jgi:SAM-dependent MidA family methyltransferase
MAIAVRDPDGWTERWVSLSGSGLALARVPARREVLAWLDAHAAETPEGGVVECQLEAASWLNCISGRLVAGSILVIDYGDTSAGLARRRRDGTLRTYRAHHLGPHPLDDPGSTDMTADVDFSALAHAARESGLDCQLVRQREFLAELGLAERMRGLRAEELELARSGDPVERLRVRGKLKEVETLLHPRGLGDFLVLVARR